MPARTFQEVFKNQNPKKIWKIIYLAIRKAFKNMQIFQRRPLHCTKIKTKLSVKQLKHNNNLTFLVADSYGLYFSLIQSYDIFCKVTQVNPFHLALFHAYQWRDVSLKYMLNIFFSLRTCITHAFFWNNLSLDILVVTNILPKVFKRFKNLAATHNIKL